MKGVRQELVRQKKAISAVLSTVRKADESHNFATINEEIMTDLRKCRSLRNSWMVPTGGRATGLGGKSSDLDIIIHFNTPRQKEQLRRLHNYPLRPLDPITITNTTKTLRYTSCYKQCNYFWQFFFLKKFQISNIRWCLTFWQVLKLVLYAKIPTVRLVHLNTNIEVDISLDTPLHDRSPAIKNTRLMTAYRRNNQRLTAIFKWFKSLVRGIKVASAATSGISTYGFSILFFFFLRKRKYIKFIDPLTFEEEEGNDIFYEHEGIILLSFLRFVIGDDITKFAVQLRKDPGHAYYRGCLRKQRLN